ncbi:MAG: HAD-IA family hydrolase [Pseudomonadota bacterium]
MKSVIFDLDGTLADTSGDLIAAANVCFRDMGYGDVLQASQDAAVALRGGRRMLVEGLTRKGHPDPEPVIKKYYPVLLEAYDQAIDHHTFLFPGAMQAVETLKSQGYAVGICTNKPEALAEKLMQSLGARAAFDSLVGADTLPVRKPDPAPLFEAAKRAGGDPQSCLLVGDSDTDRNTATAAHVPCILVGFGPSGDDMAALNPDALIESFEDLPGAVRRLMPLGV